MTAYLLRTDSLNIRVNLDWIELFEDKKINSPKWVYNCIAIFYIPTWADKLFIAKQRITQMRERHNQHMLELRKDIGNYHEIGNQALQEFQAVQHQHDIHYGIWIMEVWP